MIDLAPIDWAIATITPWHIAIFVLATILVAVASRKHGYAELLRNFIVSAAVLLACYGLFALLVGQALGDKYPFAELWPSSFILGAILTGAMLGQRWRKQDSAFPPGYWPSFLLISCGFFSFALYILPRMAGLVWEVLGIPNPSWAVSL